MTTHIMDLESIWFDYIKKKQKIIEGRAYDDKRKKIKDKDIIIFCNNETKEEIKVVVDKLGLYKDCKMALTKIKMEDILPSIKTIEDGEYIYNKYLSDKIKEYGFVLIYFHVI